MTIEPWFRELLRIHYDKWAQRDYAKFEDIVRKAAASGTIGEAEVDEVLLDFPNPTPKRQLDWEEDDGAEAKLRNPPDVGPLARIKFRGWITDELAAELRMDGPKLQSLLGIDDDEVLNDVQENALHVLGRCNNPADWGRNRQGLVYGMVQSGKTANMIALIRLARDSGYRLFILLAGDKTTLRDQTQRRINTAFGLQNGGANVDSLTHSPTWIKDFRSTGLGYQGSFRYLDLARGERWTTIIVVKKQKDHLRELAAQIRLLKGHMAADARDFATVLPTMILDDEADYASQNTNVYGIGNTIHNELVELRQVIPSNTYVGYTATPQACISASLDDPIGYPRDFIWLLEPFMDRDNGGYVPRSYAGAWEVFWDYDRWLVHDMGRNEWPHHERGPHGKYRGIYIPNVDVALPGSFVDDTRFYEVETQYLDEVLRGARPLPPTVQRALTDYIITCGVRWWQFWRREGKAELPTRTEIEERYPHHAMIVHLSVTQGNQERVRGLTQRQWADAVQSKRQYSPDTTPPDDLFRERLRLQAERTERLMNGRMPPWPELSYLIDRCIEITETPINDPRSLGYGPFPGSPFVYLLNSSDDGTDLFYGEESDPEIRTKKAAVIVGGQILSRGLTIEGLAVSIFGRTQEMPLGDATLQMGRWFGHRKGHLDLVCVHLQRQARELMRELADADRYLRLQIKDAIYHGHPPDRILLELRNSPFFRVTSPRKSVFLTGDGGRMSFSGKLALLEQPLFNGPDIRHNLDRLEYFAANHDGEAVHDRATLYRNVNPDDVLNLLNSLHCAEDASQVSFSGYAQYLEDWRDRNKAPLLPNINVAIMDTNPMTRQRLTTVSRPRSTEEARSTVEDRFGSIVGGRSGDGSYKGDAFMDRDRAWHLTATEPEKTRQPGDDILIVFYRLSPNYVCKYLHDSPSAEFPEGRRTVKEVYLQPGDAWFVDTGGDPKDPEGRFSVVVFAAWTPGGGPTYPVKVNRLVDPDEALQIGRQQTGEQTSAEEG